MGSILIDATVAPLEKPASVCFQASPTKVVLDAVAVLYL